MLIDTLGTGYPIIFIHGWAMNKDIFMPFFEKLDKNKREHGLGRLRDRW